MTAETPSSKGHVLIVDDDALALEVARDRLADAGYQVTVQHGAMGTLATAMRERPDFVLLDVNMPGIPGDAIARLMTNGRRTRGRAVSIILYSSQELTALNALARSCGAVGAVQKTHDARKFMDQFDACVAAARLA
jgi:two-component system cell cycle response regulator DivK